MGSTVADLHPEDVKAAIRKRGTTLTALAHEHGYDASAIGLALRRPWPAVEAIIARAIGATPQAIWPSRYDAQGRPLSRPKRRGPLRRRHRQI